MVGAMSSGGGAALLPAPRRETDPQVLLIRSLADDVTQRRITHQQAVAELRRQLSRELGPTPPRAAAGS